MREDMAQVIVERPRIKPFKTRKGRCQPLDDLPKHEGMRRGHAERGDTKHFNENLTPLRRYLESQVGRPWNKVYAEIAANLRVDSTVQQHVRGHLRDFVAVTPRRDLSSWHSSIRGGLWWQRLYVDPVTGLLCRTDRLPEEKARQRARRAKPAPPVEHVRLDDHRELRLIEGIWYEVTLAPLPEPVYRIQRETRKLPLVPYSSRTRFFEADINVGRLITPPVRDVARGEMIEVGPVIDDAQGWAAYRRERPDRRYATAKRVLSRRELRRYGLKNSDA
jgi:hypothetical protein